MPHVYAGRRSLRLRLRSCRPLAGTLVTHPDFEVAGQRPALPIGFVERQRRATPGGVISLG